ncbi:transcription termination factor MTERF15, mitochondrial [Olea europaea subsp. europaea]|uniref:Transcription termination factor MTERF15, mitochondrial n=1 Tax=Olea europaea subsp. europaea TaxID=158383 RepID=A0A8S0R6P0_OLEEU|nr:transcription termination factor MTERF15, mitochondrial [Olea europaea subsp. europaea]
MAMLIRNIKTRPPFLLLFRSIYAPVHFIPYPNSQSFSTAPKSHQKNLIPVSNLFQRYGFPPSELPHFLKKNQFLLNSNTPEIEKSLKILSSLNPSQDFVVSVLCSCPSVLELEFLEKWQLGISELGISNVSIIAIRNILEVSRKYDLKPDDVFRCIKCLKRLGFRENTVTRVLEAVPMVIMSSEEKIRGKTEFLIRLGIQKKEIDQVVCSFPGILAFGVENRLKPLIDEFEDLGYSLSEVRREVIRDPRILGLENGEFSQCLKLLKSLRCRLPIKENIFRHGAFRAGYEVKIRVDCLRKHGLIYREAFTVLWKEPRVILYEIEEIEKKIEFLVQEMEFDVQCLVEVPEYLGVHLGKQIVPRFNVIKHLRSIGGLGDEVGLRDLIKLSRLRFYNRYVKPYSECKQIYGRFGGGSEVRSRHPVGMWKLFKPQNHPKSNEDSRNIKSYMESLA